MIVATACFDGNVRLFQILMSYNEDKDKYSHDLTQSELIRVMNIQQDFEKIDFSNKRDKKVSHEKMKRKIQTESEKVGTTVRTVFEHRHPNCITFDETGRMYIGDSLGVIHIWEIRLKDGNPICNKIKTITHFEIEGDAINQITLEPKNKRLLLVHSRDNCIRTIDVNSDRARIITRFYGLKSNKTNIKSTISPDGNYVISGSEEGKPLIWSFHSATSERSDSFQCGFVDSVNDVCWNNKYNMMSISGFGQEYPVLVYVHEKKEITIDIAEKILKEHDKEYDIREEDGESERLNSMDDGSSYHSQIKSDIKSNFRSSDVGSKKSNIDSSFNKMKAESITSDKKMNRIDSS